jgi:hypothetical protein
MAFSSAYDTLYRWARKTTSAFGELRFAQSGLPESTFGNDKHVYRLRHWPELPSAHRTAVVYKALSLMSNRPVNRGWFVRHSRMKQKEVDGLIAELLAQGALEVVDVSSYRTAR